MEDQFPLKGTLGGMFGIRSRQQRKQRKPRGTWPAQPWPLRAGAGVQQALLQTHLSLDEVETALGTRCALIRTFFQVGSNFSGQWLSQSVLVVCWRGADGVPVGGVWENMAKLVLTNCNPLGCYPQDPQKGLKTILGPPQKRVNWGT